jgi:hypothetical protein
LNEFHPNELDPYLLFDARDSMIGTLENPTLDLDPSKPDTLNVITATRSGVATYTDVNGNIATASADTVRVDYTQGAELTPTKFQRVNYTDFSSGWVGQAGVTFEAGDEYENQPVRRVIYDGVTTGGIYQTIVNTVGGVSYTGSFYARRISGSNQIYIRHGFSASGNQTILPVTTEWQKFSVTILGASGGGNVYFGIIQFSAGDDIYEITQPQFEEGTTASDFVENTTGSPKFITGATYGPRVPMILVEPSATNIIYNSSSFSTSGTAVKTTGFEAPDGTNTATKISNMQDATGIRAYSQVTAVSGSTAYVGSIYLKGTAGETVRIEARRQAGATYSSSGTQLLTFDGTWQRVTNLAWTTAADNTAVFILVKNESGTTADEVYLWGSQLEEGSVSTSVIPTSGSTVTRAADDLVISGSDFDFYNQSEGTWYCEAVPKGNDGSENYTFILEYGTSNSDRVGFFYYVADGSLSVTGFNSNSQYYNQLKLGDSTNQLARLSYSYQSGNHKSALNGTSDSDTDTVVPPANQLKLGKRIVGTNGSLVGHIKRLIYWPYHSDSL